MTGGTTVDRGGKIFYPADGISKGAVFDYYRAVAEVMLPHLRGRPLTMRRYPDGIDGENFFQKDASDYFPDWIDTVTVEHKRQGGATRYVLCQDTDTLLYLVNQACLEFHVWTATAEALDRPDRLVIDLDPGADEALATMRRTATRLRELLARLGLTAFVQTTGGRGYHVVAPLDRGAVEGTVRDVAKRVAWRLAERDPEHLTTEQYKDKRGGRIFLDTNRNGYGQTWICPYSLRARPGATAATPLDWRELSRVTPGGYRLDNLPPRLARKADPWQLIDRAAAAIPDDPD